MTRLLLVLLLSSSFLLAQDSNSSANDQKAKDSKGEITVQGCVDRARGDYILIQQNPAITYLLRGANKIKIRQYFGQQVEVTGMKSPSLSTSSDSIAFGGSPAPLTLTATSIKTLAKQCTQHPVPH